MIPFCCAAGTSFHVTEMLVELLFCPLTFCGAPSGPKHRRSKQSFIARDGIRPSSTLGYHGLLIGNSYLGKTYVVRSLKMIFTARYGQSSLRGNLPKIS